jgi:hypothetical protein
MDAKSHPALPSLGRAVVVGALGFGVVSLCVFATVAFGERWMFAHLGVLGAYLAWTALFVLLGGAVMGSLVSGRWRLPKFYLLFGPAFFVYAAGWIGAYFTLRRGAGEWAGSLAGSVLMALVFVLGFRAIRSTLKFSAILFVANSIGYFLGSALNNYYGGKGGNVTLGPDLRPWPGSRNQRRASLFADAESNAERYESNQR